MDSTEEHSASSASQLYKFRELKAYSSTEWLADNKKKYRQVFDKDKTAFVYAELSFFNKQFDNAAWEAQIQIRCINLTDNRQEVCKLNLKKKISKYDHTVYIREGWGNKREGTFWTKGTYYWEAWIEGVKVATKYFYIEEMDQLDEHEDEEEQSLSLNSVRLYEGKYDDVPLEERRYFSSFAVADTRYIYAEIQCDNLNPYASWQCEVFIKFFNQSRELKGQVIRLIQVKANDEHITFTAGWGANIKGSWRAGIYSVEIVFMDQVIGILPFEVGDDFVEGVARLQRPHDHTALEPQEDEIDGLTLEDIMQDLEALIGLQPIKQRVRDHAQYLKFVQLRKDRGFKEEEDLAIHAVFMGNPGTGKTTVARMMGRLYRKMGLLSRGHVHEVDRVSLVGEYIGQTAPKVKEAIQKARGGILFIDEAYALARTNDDTKDFGREVIEILIKEMSDGEGDMAVMVAGYPKEMTHFLNSNPGLRSRFKLYYQFDDYSPDELWMIAETMAEDMELDITPPAQEILKKTILMAYRDRNRNFGNARFVYDLIEKTKINLGLRIMQEDQPEGRSASDLRTVLEKDVIPLTQHQSALPPVIPIDQELLDESLAQLDALIGMKQIKREVHELVALVRYYQSVRINPLNKLFLHTLFIGNPGTGKTTVARLLTNIFRALGILERGHIVETDRQGLVAGYVGQTAIKTSERVDEALGGVLFIDEAYALTGSQGVFADYGHEAIQALLKRMEDDRGRFFIFAAGYPQEMQRFLKSNPGLRSRFDKILQFDDYSAAELHEIACAMLLDEGKKLTPSASDYLLRLISLIHQRRDKYFGNARTIRQLVTSLIKHQHLRLSAHPEKRDQQKILVEDIKKIELVDENKVFAKSRIGFNKGG